MSDQRDAWTSFAEDRGLAAPKLPFKGRRRDEGEFQDRVLDYAALNGWLAYHVPDSRRVEGAGAAGFPDLVLCRSPRLVFVELKSRTGRVSPEQAAWLDSLKAAGAETYVWRPADWDAIEERLKR